ncbi:MAG: major capsid protein [Thalassospira sp.]|uniref:major capsid protein n=1 Tax=Thalassospira sp. TaxID=1912094 RepID=UPI003A86F4E3
MDTYSTTDLLGVLTRFSAPDMFVLDRYFGALMLSDKSAIALDEVIKGKKLAPFVMDTAKAKAGIREGFTTTSFKPATLKPMDVVDPERLLARMPGEALGAGSMSPGQRRDANIAAILMDHRNEIMRRKLWMGWQVLRTGQVVVEGPEYPSRTVDFNRDPLLTKALIPADLWSDPSADIFGDLEAWAADIQNKSGVIALDVFVAPTVWSAMRKNTAFMKLLDNRRGTNSSIEIGPISVNSVRFVGTVGDFNIFVYAETYQDDDGNEIPYLGADEVVMVGTGIQGVQAHGAILDKGAGYTPMEYFPKIIEEDNPSIESVLTQSRPLIVPGNVNASLCATVL